MGLRPTQGDENRVEEGSVGNYTFLCHLDRSEAKWRDSGFPHLAQRARRIWGTLDWWRFWIRTPSGSRVPHPCVARVGDHDPLAEQASHMIFDGAKRSGEICGLWVPNRGSPLLRFTLTQMWETADLSTSLRSGRDDKVRCSCQPSLPQPDFHPLGWAAVHELSVEMTNQVKPTKF